MPRYRVKSGTLNFRDKRGKTARATAGSVIDLTPEIATKFKNQLEPLDSDSIFTDETAEETALRREYLRIVKVRELDDQRILYNVVNTITGKLLNDEPLELSDAELLAKGVGIPTKISFEGETLKEVKQRVILVDEDETSSPPVSTDPELSEDLYAGLGTDTVSVPEKEVEGTGGTYDAKDSIHEEVKEETPEPSTKKTIIKKKASPKKKASKSTDAD